jgi:hypothetical protein
MRRAGSACANPSCQWWEGFGAGGARQVQLGRVIAFAAPPLSIEGYVSPDIDGARGSIPAFRISEFGPTQRLDGADDLIKQLGGATRPLPN